MDKILKFENKKALSGQFKKLIRCFVSEANYYNNISQCGENLNFLSNLDNLNAADLKLKLCSANFCKNRFCPMCMWRKSIADSIKISTLTKYAKIELNYEFLFLTLTVPNVNGKSLNERIDRLQKDIDLFIKYKDVKKFVCGYIKKLELTYNDKAKTYHPHLHLLIAVDKDYFINNRKYMQRYSLLKLWQRATNDSSITQLDIRRAKNVEKELAKYTAKSNDYLINQTVFNTIYKALKGRKLITYCGDFNKINKMYKEGELDYLIATDDIIYNYMINYTYKKVCYNVESVRPLTDDEKIKYNNLLLKYDVEMED